MNTFEVFLKSFLSTKIPDKAALIEGITAKSLI